MRSPTPALLVAVLLLAPTPSLAQERELTVESNALTLTVGGRVQTQFNTTSVEGQPPSQLIMRRARIELGLEIDDRVTGELSTDFGEDAVEIKDVFLNVALSPGLNFLFGKTYRPFGLLEQTTSKRYLPIERGLRIRGLRAADEYAFLSGLQYSNRDIGVQIHGEPAGAPLGLAYAAGVLRGPMHGEVPDVHSFQYAGRVTISPAELLRLGAGISTRDFAEEGASGTVLRRGAAMEVDVEYGAFAPGLHVLAELSRGALSADDDARFWGAHTWIGSRTEELPDLRIHLEPMVRISHSRTSGADPVADRPGGTLVTPGVNIYLTPLNRLMFNYDIWQGEQDTPDARSFKAMFQFAF